MISLTRVCTRSHRCLRQCLAARTRPPADRSVGWRQQAKRSGELWGIRGKLVEVPPCTHVEFPVVVAEKLRAACVRAKIAAMQTLGLVALLDVEMYVQVVQSKRRQSFLPLAVVVPPCVRADEILQDRRDPRIVHHLPAARKVSRTYSRALARIRTHSAPHGTPDPSAAPRLDGVLACAQGDCRESSSRRPLARASGRF